MVSDGTGIEIWSGAINYLIIENRIILDCLMKLFLGHIL